VLIPNAVAVADMAEGFAPVKEAMYNFRIDKADYVAVPKGATSKGNPYINVAMTITGAPGNPDAPETGRKVFEMYMLTGESSFRLRDLLEATGHGPEFQLADTDQLLGLEFQASVTIEKGDPAKGYADRNRIRKHMPLQGVPAAV
jgi:hypothetical protein